MTIPEIIKEFEEKFSQDSTGEKVSGYLLAKNNLSVCCGVPIVSSGIPYDGTNATHTKMCGKCGDLTTSMVKIAIPDDLKSFLTSRLSSLLNEIVVEVENHKYTNTYDADEKAVFLTTIAEVAQLIKAKMKE